jgi:hypothetical protein
MLEVVTHAGHQAREYWLQHRGGEGKSRLAADGDSQQGKEYTDPAGEALAIEQVVAQIRLVPSPTAPPAGTRSISTRVFAN